jgi:hypothetical protein
MSSSSSAAECVFQRCGCSPVSGPPLALVRADLLVAAVAPLREDDGPFVRPWAGKDRHLEAAVIVAIIGDSSGWVDQKQPGPGGDADPAPIGHLQSCRPPQGAKVSLAPMAQTRTHTDDRAERSERRFARKWVSRCGLCQAGGIFRRGRGGDAVVPRSSGRWPHDLRAAVCR